MALQHFESALDYLKPDNLFAFSANTWHRFCASMDFPRLSATVISALALTWVTYKLLRKSRKGPHLPHGPPGDPIIGHMRLLHSARGNEGSTFFQLSKQYGGIFSLKALGQNIVVVNDHQIATELLEKRGSIYSSRPRTVMNEIMGMGQDLSLMPYGENFRIHRRLFLKYFRQEKVKEFHSTQVREARNLLQNLLATPESWEDHLLRFSTSVIIDVAFGHTMEGKGKDDPYLQIAEDVCKHIMPALAPSEPLAAGLALAFPFLKYMPEWFPGAFYPRRARNCRPFVKRYYEYPLADVKRQLTDGTARPSFLATQLDELQSGEADSALNFDHIQGAAAMIYQAGMDTTSSTIGTFIAAMVLYPECFEKAQAEVDRVIGSDRLPTFEDRDSLPYLDLVLQELQRWQPTIPLLPHYSVEDDVYDGMFIPKNTLVIGNTRGMSWDENVYTEPHVFNPDRYLPAPSGRGEPVLAAAFGFGRRVCPGRYFGSDSVWIAAAHLIAAINIRRPIGPNGKEYKPDIKFHFGGVTNHATGVKCIIEPRSGAARSLILEGIAGED